MEIIIGTRNKAKIWQFSCVLSPLGFDVKGLPDGEYPDVAEGGDTALENARVKASFYSKEIGLPVLSTDNALYLEGLASENQPGLNVRRLPGRSDRVSDFELLEYYAGLVRDLGGQIGGYWEYGICLAYPDGRLEETVIRSPRHFVSCPSRKMIEGYPLESIQIEPVSGRYISEMSPEEQDLFWQETVGRDVADFIRRSGIA